MHNQTGPVRNWRQFGRRVRPRGCDLLKCLGDFEDAVLVAGCQRSGTTALARAINQADGVVSYRSHRDDELDAALILSGAEPHRPLPGKYCFQTTYLNQCFREYIEHRGEYRLIWVLRNPQSVVYSMLHNWGRFAFNELFRACGVPLLSKLEAKRYHSWGRWGVSSLRRACLSYNGKVKQLDLLKKELGPEDLLVVDYNELVRHKRDLLPRVFEFSGLIFREKYLEALHARSVAKKIQLPRSSQDEIEQWCGPVYQRALRHLTLTTQRPVPDRPELVQEGGLETDDCLSS